LILSLHSTEHERTQGYHPLSEAICAWEKRGVEAASLIIVPHSSTRQQVINLYGADPDKVVIIPDVLAEHAAGMKRTAGDIKRGFGLNPDAPLLLFAGEISHAAGADLLVDALPIAFRQHATAQVIFAGDGALRGELEGRVWHTGLGHRCKFFGDVNSETFEALLLAAEFAVIPARTWQDGSLAQMVIDYGKPVLTTHQAGIRCVVHGQNGLVTYDNPGSIVWGIQELLGNPLQGNLLRLVAKKKTRHGPSLDNIGAQFYTHYEIVLKHFQETRHALRH
jgi:glycosyltransferase involved in cell wall biosynthesis